MRSGLYTGTLIHSRREPRENVFRYGVYFTVLDLDELAELDRRLALVSVERPNVLSLRSRDHLGDPPAERGLAVEWILDGQDDLAFRFGGSLRQLIAARHHHDVGFDARRRRGDAAAQAEHWQDVMRRFDHLEAFVAAHPPRNHHPLGVHIVETILLHRLDGPRDGAIQVVGAAEALAEGIRQFGQAIPRELIRLRGGDQFCGVGAIRIEPFDAG